MQSEFCNHIREYITDEQEDNGKYAKLAEIAPTEKARKILSDISKEEEKHKEFLKEILNDCESTKSSEEKEQLHKSNVLGSESNADH